MKKSAFTMLELVFVIAVVGILAAVFIPRFERDNAGEAAYQIARHIRLAQHHALVENRFNDPSLTAWKGTLWRISFFDSSGKECYMVFSDRNMNGGNPSEDERAVDPLSKRYVWGNTTCDDSDPKVNDEVLLTKSFGVSSLSVCGGVGPKHIAFDHLGRPGRVSMTGSGATGTGTFTPLAADCVIAIGTNNGHSAEVTVYQDTGFAQVTKIDSTPL